MKLKHWLVFFLLGAIWSSSFMWIKIAVQEVSPITLVAYRVLFGLLFGLAVITIQRVRIPRDLSVWRPLLLVGITNLAIPFFLISWGQQFIDSSVAAILDATVPLFTIVFSHLVLSDDKITLPKVLWLLVGFAGVVILMSNNIGASTSSLLGQAAVILASVFYAGSAIYIRKSTQEIPAILRSAGPLVSATAVMWLAAFLTERPVQVPQLAGTWAALLFLGFIGSGFAFVLAFYLIHEIGPTRSTMVTFLFPLGGVIFGVVFLNEQLTWQLAAGAILIVSSLVIANRPAAEPAALSKTKARPSRT